MIAKDKLSEQELVSSAQSPSSLPPVNYGRKRIVALIKPEYVPLSGEHKEKIDKYLNAIDNEVEKFKLYLSEEVLSDFYELMKDSILEIHNATGEIYQIITKYNEVAASKIKKIIEDSITPLEKN